MENGAKRKLPPWMSRAGITGNTDGQSEAEKGVGNANNSKDETASQPLHPKSKTTEKPVVRDATHDTLVNDLKKRNRKNSRVGVNETLVERKKGNSGGRKIKSKRKERNHETSEEIESHSPNEDDGELTVEDLLTIAQEYVRRDENLRQRQISDGLHDGKTNSTIALSVHDSRGLPSVPPQNKEPTMPKKIVTIYDSIARTGDPAQDMLDLLLGPLLRKPVSEEKMIKTVEEDGAFVREVKEKVHENSIASADFVPLTKKKSSLKDKVAMFSD